MAFPKLLLLHVSSTGLIVVLLAAHFPADDLAKARVELEQRGAAYSGALAERLSSDGSATIDSIPRGPEVSNVLLLTAAVGEPPLPVVEQPYVLEFSDRIAFVHSVRGAARGTLVVELSTQRLAQVREDMLRTAAVGGAGAIALGFLLAFVLARLGRALDARAGRERALEVVLDNARPANDTRPESLPRAG